MFQGNSSLMHFSEPLADKKFRPYGTIFANDIFSSGIILSEYVSFISNEIQSILLNWTLSLVPIFVSSTHT
jgi:hypothetical protein